MSELLLSSILFFFAGTSTGYFIKEDKYCKTIETAIPDRYLNEYNVTDCLEDIEVGITKECGITMPRYVVSEEEYFKLNMQYKGVVVHLQECKNVIEEYNKDKYLKF